MRYLHGCERQEDSYHERDAECLPGAKQMMVAAIADDAFDWAEAERLSDLRDFKVLDQLQKLRNEMTDVLAWVQGL